MIKYEPQFVIANNLIMFPDCVVFLKELNPRVTFNYFQK
jgi:hypothetical protein